MRTHCPWKSLSVFFCPLWSVREKGPPRAALPRDLVRSFSAAVWQDSHQVKCTGFGQTHKTLKCLSWQPLLTSLVYRPLHLQLIASNIEGCGLGDLISCDDYYNSILCIDWSRVYKTLSCVETSLVPRPHLVRISHGKTHNTESDPCWG